MECSQCEHREFDHYVEGAPTAVYTCGHTNALEVWVKYNGEICPIDEDNRKKAELFSNMVYQAFRPYYNYRGS